MNPHIQKWIRVVVAGLVALAIPLAAAQSGRAQTPEVQPSPEAQQQQSPEVQQLKDRLKQLEQTVEELKGQLKTIEGAQKPGAAVGEAISAPAGEPGADAPDPAAAAPAKKQDGGNTFEVYGFVMMDSGYQFKQQHPDWFDVIRPTKLPSFPNEFGPDGHTYFGVRQTRFGARSSTPTKYGDLKTLFEFELFGTGVDAGQTTFRLRHAYGEIGQVGAGQTWSPFMDIDVFPNTLEYWGPNGMVFFRNVQARWMPIKGRSRVTVALERPGASGDQGDFAERIELEGIRTKFAWPDLSWEARLGRKWGYVEAAGIFRSIRWVDTRDDDEFDLGGSAFGWGLNFSSNYNFTKKDIGRFQLVFGEGIQNYMNDAPVDVGVETNFGDPRRPIRGVALPVVGVVAFLDHTWNRRFSSSVGYSMLDIDNSDGQSANAFRRGHYGVGNLLFYPVEKVMVGGEFQWGRRVNNTDGFSANDYRMQFSFKYNFSKLFEF